MTAPFLVLWVYRAIDAVNHASERAQTESLNLAKIIAAEVGQFVSDTRHQLEYLSNRPAILALDPANCDPLIVDFQKRMHGYNNLLTLDLDGKLICSAVEPGPGGSRKVDPSYFLDRLKRTDAFTVGIPARGFVTGKWTVALAQPLHNAQGQLIGVVQAALDISKLLSAVAPALPNDGSVATLIDSQGIVVSRSQASDQFVGQNVGQFGLPSSGDMWDRQLTTRGAGADGIVRQWGRAVVPGTDWTALVGVPSDIADRELNHDLVTDIVAIGIAILLALIVAIRVSRRLEQPVQNLHAIAERVRAGDFTARALAEGPSELRDLSFAINRAMETIADDLARRTALEAALLKFRSAVEQSSATVVITDLNGIIEYVNPQFARTTGYTLEEAIGNNPRILKSGDKDQATYAKLWQTVLSGESWVGEFTNRKKSGELYHEQAIISPVFDDRGQLTNIIAVKEDITRRKIAEMQLADSEEHYRLLAESAPIGIVIHDGKTIRYANRTFLRMHAIAPDRLGQIAPLDLIADPDRDQMAGHMRSVLSGTPLDLLEHCRRRTDGSCFYAEIIAVPLTIDGKSLTQAMILDIDERKRAEAQAEHLAHHDVLTGLPNRTLLSDRLAVALLHAQRDHRLVTVLAIGIDSFKYVNDVHGHDVGDVLLKDLAQRVQSRLRAGDTLSRIGGDVFVAALDGVESIPDAGRVANEVRALIGEPFDINGHDFEMTASIGVALFPADGENPAALLRNADAAMHEAKRQGRNQISFFRADYNQAARERLELQLAMHRGFERREFWVAYQPQFDLRTGRLRGFEALARWNSPDGAISPGKFIPIAEKTGQIVALGEYVIAMVLDQIVAWRGQGLSVPRIGVNIAADHLARDTFANDLLAEVARRDIDGHDIDIEITESNLVKADAIVVGQLTRLRAVGMTVSIDDFGTGYSSLLYLKNFPVDTIKVDQGFVRALEQSTDDQAVVRAIIALARALGKRTVAEGVERAEQRDFLTREGCDIGQGYMFARPMTPEDAAALMRQIDSEGLAS